MMISQTAEYALRAVVVLARSPDQRLTTRELAACTGTPPGYLSKVLQHLARAGLIESLRGLRGGFRLGRPPAEISLLEVVAAVEPLPRPAAIEPPPPELAELNRRLTALRTALLHDLAATTLADLLQPLKA